jgi:hypothetical protein
MASPSTKRLTKPVTFTYSPEEQVLLKAIDNELKNKKFSTFSELCKHALRQLLLPTTNDQIEQRITGLEAQLTELTERLVLIEAKLNDDSTEHIEIKEETAADPVLDRLRPLLEDF